jgi:hypothetical protein
MPKIIIIEDNYSDDEAICNKNMNDEAIYNKNMNDEAMDDDDDLFNVSKLETVHNIVNTNNPIEPDISYSFMNNATILRNMMVKTIDKYKIDMCTQMASQFVDIYNGPSDK